MACRRRTTAILPTAGASGGKAVTQLAYARAGIITPEMEFIAIRENLALSEAAMAAAARGLRRQPPWECRLRRQPP